MHSRQCLPAVNAVYSDKTETLAIKQYSRSKLNDQLYKVRFYALPRARNLHRTCPRCTRLVPAFSSLAPDVCFVFFASTCGRSVSTNIGEEEEKKVEPFNPSFSTFVCQRERDERFVSDGAPTLDLSADIPNDKMTFI